MKKFIILLLLLGLLTYGCLDSIRKPASLSASVKASITGCTGAYTYSIELKDADGKGIKEGEVAAYANGVLLEKLVTDQNGRLSSTKDIPDSWCGNITFLKFVYAGDYFHKNDSKLANLTVKMPTKLQLTAPNQSINNSDFTIKIKLTDEKGAPLVLRPVFVSNGIAKNLTTMVDGTCELTTSFNQTGTKSIKASYAGDEFHLASESQTQQITVIPESCSDGTYVGECSAKSQSYFCNFQKQLLFDCSECGCASGLICNDNACITAEQLTVLLVSQLQESVVYVENSYAVGSGVIIAHKNGNTVILTNRHVVADASGISDVSITTYDQDTATAKDIHVAPYDVDLAVIYVSGTYGEVAQINNSQQVLQGQEVLALGSPGGVGTAGGLQGSVSSGIVSNFVSQESDGGYDVSFIQLTAPITHGNSGGGLFLKSNGNLIGINSLILLSSADYSQTGFGFAIDIKELDRLSPYDNWATFVPTPRCSDGTEYGYCSEVNAGYSCSNGYLVPDCQSCGCSSEYPYCATEGSDAGTCFDCNYGEPYADGTCCYGTKYTDGTCCAPGYVYATYGECCPSGTYYSGGQCWYY